MRVGVRIKRAHFRTNINPHKCQIRSQRSPRSVPGASPFAHRRVRPAAPGKGTENDHFQQQVNNGRAVGDSSRKCRVGIIHTHSPISLTLPLSSPKGDGLRNNSSSRSQAPSASFRKLYFGPEKKCNGSSARLGVRGRASVH